MKGNLLKADVDKIILQIKCIQARSQQYRDKFAVLQSSILVLKSHNLKFREAMRKTNTVQLYMRRDKLSKTQRVT